MSNIPHIVSILKREARDQAAIRSKIMEQPTTGEVAFGAVRVHYYPACDQFTFWVYSDRMTQERFGKWLTMTVSE